MISRSRLGFLILTGLTIAALTTSRAQAQIQNQPTEIISASPLSSFSERSGLWPTQRFSRDRLTTDRSDFSEHLNTVPGVQARTNGSPLLSIRGSGQTDRALRLFEGIPLNMADGVGASDLFLPSEAIGSLSLIKGPASVFYGASAMAGALDHRMRFFERPALRLSAADEGGTIGSRAAFGALPFSARSALTRGQFTIFHERVPGQFPFTSTSTTQAGRRQSNASDLSRATLAADAKRGAWDFRARAVAAKSVGESPGSLQLPFSSTFDTTVSLLSFEARRAFANDQFVGLRLSDARLWGLYDRDTATTSTSSSSRTGLSLDSRVSLSPEAGMRTFGDFSTQNIAGTYLGSSRFYQGDADIGQSYEIPVAAQVTLQPGYRYRSSSGHWFKSLGVFHDTDQWREYLTYAEGFRTASLSDRFGNFGTFRGNPSLQPERAWSIEAGASFESGRRYGDFLDGWAAQAAIFDTHYDDLVDTQTVGATTTKINSGRARTFGAEASLATTISIWTMSLDYAYLNARNESVGEPLRISPEHQASASLSQQLGPFIIEGRATLWSEFMDRDPVTSSLRTLPSWNTFDFEVRSLGLNDWEVRGGVLNLFDRPRELTLGYPEPQRRFFVSLLRFL